MSTFSQFTLSDRSTIEHSLNIGTKVSAIALSLGKSQSSVQREINRHILSIHNYGYTNTNNCLNLATCKIHHLCSSDCHYKDGKCKNCGNCNSLSRCKDFIFSECPLLKKAPHVCNGCSKIKSCRFLHKIYRASDAETSSRSTLVDSRSGVDLSESDLTRLNTILKKGLNNNQSLHAIMVANADCFNVDERSLYNYIDRGLLKVRNIDLPRKCSLKPRKSKKRQSKVDKKCRIGRTYIDFQNHMAEHPDTLVVEMDTVEGVKGGKVILTLYFRNCGLQLYYIREHNDSQSVIDIIDMLYEKILGVDVYKKLFPVILTDNGSEFSNPLAIEFDAFQERRSFVFYCDPSASYQKGACERNHEFFRYFFKKGCSFDELDQAGLDIIASHLNSYIREKLNNQSPTTVFSFLYGEEILHRLSLIHVSPNDVTLNRSVLNIN